MGMDDLLTDENEIEEQLDILEKAFDFVIILEYYIESIVLLAAHLNVPLEFMYVKFHKVADEYPKTELNVEQMATFKEFFKIDILMYQRFNQTLHTKIDAFGISRMEFEKQRFNDIADRCKSNPDLCFPKDMRRNSEKKNKNLTEYVQIDRDYVVKQMEDNRGYCGTGLQNIFREHQQMPFCVTKRGRDKKGHSSYLDMFEPDDNELILIT